ncbi:hypothetical protein [Methanocella sp. MCL-LM]|uniref:hypothetical protein n=1 Tax=Methanocella sp. MCL-LM TaxID=3412035 RepID=UPI003C75568B
MRSKSSGKLGGEEDIDTLAETLCSHVKELYRYNEEIERKRSSLTDIEREITDLERKARYVTDSINKLQAKIGLQD